MNKRNSIYEECCDYKSMGNFTLSERVRHSCPEVFCKNGVLRNFAKLTVKYLCQSLFFNDVADFKPATLLKKGLWHRCFLVNFAIFLRTSFLTEHLRWLFLKRKESKANSKSVSYKNYFCDQGSCYDSYSMSKLPLLYYFQKQLCCLLY